MSEIGDASIRSGHACGCDAGAGRRWAIRRVT